MIEEKILMKLEDSYKKESIINLSGELKSLLIQTLGIIDIEIKSIYGYTIFKKLQHVGTEYIPIKVLAKDADQNYLSQKEYNQYDSFFLNEKVIITITGSIGSGAYFIFRLV